MRGHPTYRWRASFVAGGKKCSKGFKTKVAATEWASSRESEALEHGTGAILTAAERNAVVETRHDLNEVGLSLREAVAMAVKMRRNESGSCTVAVLADQWIASRERAGRSKRHLNDLKSKLGRFKATYGGRSVASMTKEEIADWLYGLKVTAKSKISYRTALVGLFNDAVKSRFAVDNPAVLVEVPTYKRAKYSALPVDDVKAVLEAATDEILPFFAIGFFTGIRSQEIERMDWSSINLVGDTEMPHGYIWLSGEDTKDSRHRQIPIPENLHAWLLPYAKSTGPIWPKNGRKIRVKTLLAAGFGSEKAGAKTGKKLRPWPNNAARHTFASYHCATHNKVDELAGIMGSSPQMILSNYRKLVSASDAAEFWKIFPPKSGQGHKTVPQTGRAAA